MFNYTSRATLWKKIFLQRRQLLNGFKTFKQFFIVGFEQLFATGELFTQFRLVSFYLSFESKKPIQLLKILTSQTERHLRHPIPFDLFSDSSEVSSYHLESRTKLAINYICKMKVVSMLPPVITEKIKQNLITLATLGPYSVESST